MATRTSGRSRAPLNLSEKALGAGGGAPAAWARVQLGSGSAERGSKENRGQGRPSAPAAAAADDRKAAGAPGKPARKSAPAVAQKGRNAGLERLPIEDVKLAGKSAGSAKARAPLEAAPAAAGKQVAPGIRAVKKPAEAAPAAAAAAKPAPKAAERVGGSKKSEAVQAAAAPAPAAKPAAKSGSSGSRDAAAAGAASGSGSKRKAAAAAAPEARAEPRAAAKAAPSAAAQEPKRQRTAEAAAPLELEAPGNGAEELVEHFSSNFRELQAEYAKLQALYEDLKAAKIDEEVQQLLEQQNRHVTEHGQKAAQLVEHYKAEAEQHAAVATELGGGAVVEQCRQLQADLMTCQQALLDKEAESLDKDRQLAAMESRLAFLERYARVYDSSDKCIQTDPPPRESASAQFPSLQSSGVEMLQAHALVPEGAAGGSVYRRPKAGGPPVEDPSYTLPARTPLPPAAGLAAAAAAGAGPAAGSAPVSGSDMELTGGVEAAPVQQDQGVQAEPLQEQPAHPAASQQQQQAGQPRQQQQQRRQSVQPVAGRVVHAAAGAALRPASAESQIQPAQGAQQRRQSMASEGVAAGRAAAAGGSRRVSAPPAVDRELQFSSASTQAGQNQAQAQGPAALLAAVPEDQPLAEEEAEQQQQQQQAGPAQGPAAPAPSAATAGPLVRVTLAAEATPASVPAPPRELALSKLTGLASTPLKGGIYQFTDPRFGFVFQLGPASPDTAGLTEEADEGGEAPGPRLVYRPVELGRAAALLPEYFQEEIKFEEAQRNNFFIQMMEALAQK